MWANPSSKANKMQSCKFPSRATTWSLNSQYNVMKDMKLTRTHTLSLSLYLPLLIPNHTKGKITCLLAEILTSVVQLK
jgi:hypothetical protein